MVYWTINRNQLQSKNEAEGTQTSTPSQTLWTLGVIKQTFMKIRETIILASLYFILVIGFGFWWAENFHNYTHFKGDESFFEIEAVGITTFIALAVFRVINQRLSWWFIMVMPFLIAFLSAFITLFLPFSGLVGGTTLDCLRVYGFVHAILTTITVFLQLQAKGRVISNHA